MNQLTTTENLSADAIERALILQDLSGMKPEDRLQYYKSVCESLGLNPLTRPFAYITLNGKLTLYALKDCTEQLRKIHGISITIVSREVVDDVYVVTARATNAANRHDESIGAVSIAGLRGDAKANALMKTETKAKRRVTLSICGMGMLDETELETIANGKKEDREEEAKRLVMQGGEIQMSPEAVEELEKKREKARQLSEKPLAANEQWVPGHSPEERRATQQKEPSTIAPGASPEPEKAAAKVETPKTTRKPATRQEKAHMPDTLDTDQLPGIETPAPQTAAPMDNARWETYKLKMKLPQYEGRLLSDLTFDELETLKESWVDRHIHKPNWPEEKRTEAQNILKAFNARLEEKLAKK